MELDPELARLAELEGFFTLRTGLPGERRPQPQPQPQPHPQAPPHPRSHPQSQRLPTLADAYRIHAVAEEPDPLTSRVREVVRRLGAPEVRIGVSVAQQGLAARLWSVALGAAALYGRVPDLDPRLLRWDADAGVPGDLWLTEVGSLPGDATTIRRVVQHGHLEPLSAALRARHRISARLLWGNAGSALAGAARELDRWARANGRTDVGDRARVLAAELLDHPDLRGTGTLSGTAFRRRSCCLYYRIPGGGVCGDCCFTDPP